MQAGDLLVLFPGLRHRYGPEPGQDWCEAFIDCDGPLMRLLEDQGLLDRHRPHLRPEPAAVKPLRRLIDDVESGRLNDPQEAQWRLHGALLLAIRSVRPDDDTALEAARRLLAANLGRPCDVRQAARAAGLGWELFRKRFRARYGLPPARWRLHARCEAAAQALLTPGATVENIAADYGFCDGAHLRRHLRTVLGMSAASFRSLHGGAFRTERDTTPEVPAHRWRLNARPRPRPHVPTSG
jgi:AraC-like DNA-binding protein